RVHRQGKQPGGQAGLGRAAHAALQLRLHRLQRQRATTGRTIFAAAQHGPRAALAGGQVGGAVAEDARINFQLNHHVLVILDQHAGVVGHGDHGARLGVHRRLGGNDGAVGGVCAGNGRFLRAPSRQQPARLVDHLLAARPGGALLGHIAPLNRRVG
ncbi:hypothetical protein RZS08_14335, partial [Arthrospira platensis SPKY1]|nr:hypothetical protein [Arthrospira platensis SPKY1]